ncbi:MAG: PilZ domain-containing protein [Candidatus Omnitrophota bacterium]
MITEQEQQKDYRLYERFRARFPVKFKHSREDFGTDVFLRDASAQGARFTTKRRMYLHDSISLEVDLPDGKPPLTLNGRIVWTKSSSPSLWDVGMEFHKINYMQTHRIFELIMPDDPGI